MSASLATLLLAIGLGLLAGSAVLIGRLATPGGAAMLAILTGLIVGFGGWAWGVVALTFVACLLVAGRYRYAHKTLIETVGRTQRLTWQGALARLGWAAVLAILFDHAVSPMGYAAFVGALAASAADLVATQLGVLSVQRPRLMTTWRPAVPGTPGAISALGTIAAVGAAWLIGLAGRVAQSLMRWLTDTPSSQTWAWLPVAALAGGMAGALLDSLLAATGQRVYYDPRRREPSEYERDGHGALNEPVRGWAWLTSDAIDLVCCAVGAAAACALATWLAHSMGRW